MSRQATYHITTYGCQMNKSDSQRLKGLLEQAGLRAAIDGESADVIVYNSCSVRQKAEDRLYGLARNFEEMKLRNPDCIIAITGCMPGRDKDGRLRERFKHVDLFFPTAEMVNLPRWISERNPSLIDPQLIEANEFDYYLKIRPGYDAPFQAFIPISNGCNKFCTYCVVPYARGRQIDRPLFDVLTEVRECALNGYKEITLLGQTVNLYRPHDREYFSNDNPFDHSHNAFAALLWELNHVNGIERIHFTAPHPQYMDDSTLDALCLPKQMNYLHLPVQSGSNEVLRRMNRPYTAQYYCDRIAALRQRKPLCALGTDIIVGFSGETEQDFLRTVDLYKQCDFDIAYLAMYSVRSGTAAARMYQDDVPQQEKRLRWRILQDLMEERVLEKNQAFIGTVVSVLTDSYDKGHCSGTSAEMKRVQWRGSLSDRGTIKQVQIEWAQEWVLYGHSV